MRILASADLHGEHDVYRWLVSVADTAGADVVVLAGDLLGLPGGHDTVEESQRVDALAIEAILDAIRVPVLYIMGNDDMIELEPTNPNLRSLHGRRVELGEVNFVGYQYSLPLMGGVFEKPEEEIRRDLEALEPLVDSGTVLVTHSPAYRILDIGILERHAGSESIRDLVEKKKPRALIHGHIHDCFGVEGLHFNVAAAFRKRAVLIDAESLDHEFLAG